MWKGKGGPMGVQQPMFQKAAPLPGPGDPRFKTTMCKFFMEGTCTKGDACTFSHGEEPGAAAPSVVGKTPCKFHAQGLCTKGDACTFSHSGGGGGGGMWGNGFGSAAWKGGGMTMGGCGKGGGGFAKGGGAWGGGMQGAPVAYGGGKGGKTPCKFFAMGQCAKGAACTFSHEGGFGGGQGFGFGGKGKGKDFGKSKGKSPGHLLPRTRISEAPFSGTVVEWKGKYGWIEPAEVIEHEKAEKHGGRLFFSMDAVTSGEEPQAGTIVEFHIFEDVSGIGAEEVTPVQ